MVRALPDHRRGDADHDLAGDDVVAMSQFLLGARREGQPFWRTFWVGGTLDEYQHGDATNRQREVRARPARPSRESFLRWT